MNGDLRALSDNLFFLCLAAAAAGSDVVAAVCPLDDVIPGSWLRQGQFFVQFFITRVSIWSNLDRFSRLMATSPFGGIWLVCNLTKYCAAVCAQKNHLEVVPLPVVSPGMVAVTMSRDWRGDSHHQISA